MLYCHFIFKRQTPISGIKSLNYRAGRDLRNHLVLQFRYYSGYREKANDLLKVTQQMTTEIVVELCIWEVGWFSFVYLFWQP